MNTNKFCSIPGITLATAAVTLVGALWTASAVADTNKTVDCLPINQIKRTKIVDDQNIIFFTSGNKSYNNHLPHKCSGLKSEDRYLYKTSLSQLCNVDMITVLYQNGAGLSPGASCGLGSFELVEKPVTDENKP